MGAHELEELSGRLMDLARTGATQAAVPLIDEMSAAFERVRSAVTSLREAEAA